MSDPSDVLRPLRRVRQVRAFTDEAVPAAVLDAIVDVGRWSGSSRNSQPRRFLVLGDTTLVQHVSTLAMPHTRALASAPAAIAIVVPAEGSAVSFAYDEGRAAERMLIAASLLGLSGGIAWVPPAEQTAVGVALGVPDDHRVRTLLAIGHPTQEALVAKSAPGAARRPRERMVARDRWTDALAADDGG